LSWDDVFKIITAGITAVGGASVIIFACSSFLAKTWANRILEKEKSGYAHDLERYRNELNGLSYEHQIKFAKLHEKRAEVISETYMLLRDAFNSVSDLAFQSEDSLDNNLQAAKNALRAVNDFFPKRRIFIKFSTAVKIDRFRTEVERTIGELEFHSYSHNFSSKFKRIHGDLSETLSELEVDFRELLGEKVDSSDL
jgi:hypothetical protein